jgi:hypothetical protein
MTATLYSLSPGKFGSTVVPFKAVGVTPGIIAELDFHSGNPYASLVRVPGARPRVVLTMPFAAAYAALSGGFGLTKLTAFEIYLAKFTDGIRSSSSDHTKFALDSGAVAHAMITGATVDQDGVLMAVVEVYPLADDSVTYPLVKTANNSLPTLAAQPDLHTLGPVSINGTVYPGLKSAGFDLAQGFETETSDGDRFPKVGRKLDASPRLFGEHSDPEAITNLLGFIGATISSNVVQYFRKFDATSGLVSNDASSAISLTIAAGRAHPLDIGVDQNGIARQGIEFLALSSTSTHPIAVSTSATVPAVP